MTNGLVLARSAERRVGLPNGLGGRTNGLTNGIGRTNGLAKAKVIGGRTVRTSRHAGFGGAIRRVGWKLYLVPIAMAAILLVQLMYVPEGEGPAYPIQIDGQFDDWAGVPRFATSAVSSLNPNIDIVQVALTDNVDFLSFYIEVRGTALQGEPSSGRLTDAFFVFIETDRSTATGYRIQGLGADRLIAIHGWAGQAVSAILMEFDANRDGTDWGGWFKSTPAKAAAAGNRVELQMDWEAIVADQAPVHAAFATRGWDGTRDSADVVVTSQVPYVVVSQDSAAPPTVVGAFSDLTRLRFEAVGADVSLDSVNLTLSGTHGLTTFASIALVDGLGRDIARVPVSGPEVSLPLAALPIRVGTPATFFVRPEVGVEDRTTVGAVVNAVRDVQAVSAGVAFVGLSGSPESLAYVGSAPPSPVVDGGFSEWASVSMDPTGDPSPGGSSDIDISRYGFQGSPVGTTFLVRTDGSVLNGTLVPATNPVYTGDLAFPADVDRDGVPDASDPLPNDFNNDGTPDVSTNGDYDGDGIPDYGSLGGTDYWLNTTIPPAFPAPYGGRVVSVFIGPVQRPVARGEDRARFYLDSDGSGLTGHTVGGIGAEYLVEVSGKHGVILSSSAFRFNGTNPGPAPWDSIGPASAAKDRTRLETVLPGVPLTNGSRGFFEIVGWSNAVDDVAVITSAPSLGPSLRSGSLDSPSTGSTDPGDVQTLDIAGNQKWFFTDAGTSGTGCATNLAASTTAGGAATSTTLTNAAASICWFTPTNLPNTFAGPWEVILDIDKIADGTKLFTPDANGDVTAWSAGAGCTGATTWDCVNDSPNDGDTSYLVSTSSAAIDSLFNIPDWTAAPAPPSPLSIVNIVVESSCRRTSAPAVDVRILVKSGATTGVGATDPGCPNSATFAVWTETWTTDPADGLPWTLSDVNALQVGVRDNDGFTREVRVSHVFATVSWVPVYSVQIDKCTNSSCTGFTILYGPTNGNMYGSDVTFTTPSIPPQTFTGNERLRFQVVLYVSGSSTPGSVLVRYNGPYPGADDSRGTIAIPEFELVALPALAQAALLVIGRRVLRRRREDDAAEPGPPS